MFSFSNLLRPSGVRLVPATLTIRIFRGEDLPQMDPGYFEGVKKFLHVGTVQKELVDPYCTVNFAGHKGRTQVIWNEQDPEWNKQINLGVRVRLIFILCMLIFVCNYKLCKKMFWWHVVTQPVLCGATKRHFMLEFYFMQICESSTSRKKYIFFITPYTAMHAWNIDENHVHVDTFESPI